MAISAIKYQHQTAMSFTTMHFYFHLISQEKYCELNKYFVLFCSRHRYHLKFHLNSFSDFGVLPVVVVDSDKNEKKKITLKLTFSIHECLQKTFKNTFNTQNFTR